MWVLSESLRILVIIIMGIGLYGMLLDIMK